MTSELIAQIERDISRRQSMPDFGVSPDTNIERLRTIRDTQQSFSLEAVTALLAYVRELELKAEKAEGYASAYEVEKWHYHGLAESEGFRAELAEKRVAKLESRTLTLPHRMSEKFWPGDASEFDSLGYEMAVKEAAQLACIPIKVED